MRGSSVRSRLRSRAARSTAGSSSPERVISNQALVPATDGAGLHVDITFAMAGFDLPDRRRGDPGSAPRRHRGVQAPSRDATWAI